jgi:hypothetical protein
MSDFATLADVKTLTGKTFTTAEETRINALLPMVSDLIRSEGDKVGKDIDEMIAASTSYASVVKLVTVDVVLRIMRQSMDDEPMSQESQSALGYSWSGTYAIPGGGMATALLNNDLKKLGLKRQKYGVLDLYEGNEDGED